MWANDKRKRLASDTSYRAHGLHDVEQEWWQERAGERGPTTRWEKRCNRQCNSHVKRNEKEERPRSRAQIVFSSKSLSSNDNRTRTAHRHPPFTHHVTRPTSSTGGPAIGHIHPAHGPQLPHGLPRLPETTARHYRRSSQWRFDLWIVWSGLSHADCMSLVCACVYVLRVLMHMIMLPLTD